MIFVTVGTEKSPFDRLMHWIEVLQESKMIDEEIVIQYGNCTVLPEGVGTYRFLEKVQHQELISQARLVISDCGKESFLLDSYNKPYILVPRFSKFQEYPDNHQVDLAMSVEKINIPVAWSIGDLIHFISNSPQKSGCDVTAVERIKSAHGFEPVFVSENNLLVQMPSKLTVVEAIALKKEYSLWMERGTIEKIILDFAKTKIIDSSGVGSLVALMKFTREKNIVLQIWSIIPQVKEVFSLIGMEKVLPIIPHTEPTSPISESSLTDSPPSTHPSVRSKTKRLMDIVGGLVGLAVVGILFIPVAIAIKLDSPGPILFSQTRCGWMGKRFKIWKFRSMVTNAEALKATIDNQAQGAFFKNENDPRITRVGRFLRKTSLDEFPQFWNVVKGDMSLIGTRPPTPDEVEQYEVPNWQRLDVRPGLSGEWQVNGRSKIRDFDDVIKLDLRYQENWSLMYDVQLIFKTIAVIFSKDSGAA